MTDEVIRLWAMVRMLERRVLELELENLTPESHGQRRTGGITNGIGLECGGGYFGCAEK